MDFSTYGSWTTKAAAEPKVSDARMTTALINTNSGGRSSRGSFGGFRGGGGSRRRQESKKTAKYCKN